MDNEQVVVDVMDRQQWLTKWNWGAFTDWFMFGCGNRTYMLFLNFIPVFNIFWLFWGGAHAEMWARDNINNQYTSEHEFRTAMNSWNRAGFVQFFLMIAMFVLYFFIFASMVTTILNGLDSYSY